MSRRTPAQKEYNNVSIVHRHCRLVGFERGFCGWGSRLDSQAARAQEPPRAARCKLVAQTRQRSMTRLIGRIVVFI
jgi:hypothetical protein